MKKYYTIQRTIQRAYPIGQDYGFKKTYQVDGLEWTEPYTSYIGGFVLCETQADALNHIQQVWSGIKHAYESDGWTAVQDDPDSADITFISPQGVYNIMTEWTLKYQK